MSKPTRFRNGWRIRWFDENGRRQSAVFHSHREAEYELRRREAEVADIRRGLRAPRAGDHTCGELFDYWIENRAPAKRSGPDHIIIRRHLRPAFAPVLLRELTAEHIDPYIRARQHLHSKTISNHLTLFVSMLNVAKDELRWVDTLPKITKPKVPRDSEEYRYLRTRDEVERFLGSARVEGDHVFILYSLAVWTGMRAGEIAALQWDDVNLDRRLITV